MGVNIVQIRDRAIFKPKYETIISGHVQRYQSLIWVEGYEAEGQGHLNPSSLWRNESWPEDR